MRVQVSSRSHALLWVTVRHEWSEVGGGARRRDARLALIDLAGSERASATLNVGARLHEGAKINRSLLALANCINALTSLVWPPPFDSSFAVKMQ